MWEKVIELIVSNCLDIFFKNKEETYRNRERLHTIMLTISTTINETIDELRADEYPHGKCAMMEQLCNELYYVLQEMIPEEKAKAISDMLHQASRLEIEYAMRDQPKTIVDLIIISGKFQALATLYV